MTGNNILNVGFRNRVGRKLALFIVLISTVFALIATTIHLAVKYSTSIAAVEQTLEALELEYVPGIRASLWIYDDILLQEQLNGIIQRPYVDHAKILQNNEQVLAEAGEPQKGRIVSKLLPLLYDYREKQITLGTLYVEASLDSLFENMLIDGLLSLLVYFGSIVLIAIFFLIVFYRVVGRHINTMAKYVRTIDYSQNDNHLILDRKHITTEKDDELDELTQAINTMREKVISDIDKLKTAKKQLREKTEQLASANIDLEAFDYSVSNALLVPIRYIRGFSKLLDNNYSKTLKGEGQKYLEYIVQGVQDARNLVDALLQLSRASKGAFDVSEVNLSNLAETAARKLPVTINGRTVKFEIEKSVVVLCNLSLMQIVIDQLFNNAWKFTVDNETTVIQFGTKIIDGESIIFISDNGIGFSQEKIEDLFIPFKQLHDKKVEGFGLGLATVERIIQRHGGKIWAESNPGEGATFFFTLQQ